MRNGTRGVARHRGWISICAAGLVLASPIVSPSPAIAAAGELDPSFGAGGLVTHTSFSLNDGGQAMAFQPDGKIVLAGYVLTPETERPRFAVARFDVDGVPDPTFGVAGVARTRFRTGVACNDSAKSLVVQPDGAIVAVGSSSCRRGDGRYDGSFALARFTSDGALDPTFGDGGRVLTSFGNPASCDAWGEAAGLASDGAIVAAGTTSCLRDSLDGRFAVARYLADGTLDTAFGGDGRVQTDLTRQYDRVSDLVIQPDGKVVVGGTAAYWMVEIPDALESRAALVRYRLDGSLDPGFGGGDGKVRLSFHSRLCPGSNESYGLALQPDGRIVEGGSAACAATVGGLTHPRWALARFGPDGSLDGTFGGGDGRVVTIWAAETGTDWMSGGVALQANGRIVAAGTSGIMTGRFTLARYRPTGRLDRTFGVDGRVRTVFGPAPACRQGLWDAVGIQTDGRIVTAGGGGCLRSFVMARFLPD